MNTSLAGRRELSVAEGKPLDVGGYRSMWELELELYMMRPCQLIYVSLFRLRRFKGNDVVYGDVTTDCSSSAKYTILKCFIYLILKCFP